MENTLIFTEELLRTQSRKLSDQVEKLVLSDNIIEQLIAENENMAFRLKLNNPVA